MTYSRDERRALCALLDEIGPDAPTLCEGWTTLDLAAHLVLREHRPDAGLGLLGGPLARYTAHVQSKIAGRVPYARLVQIIRDGPTRFSMFAIPGMDERANLVEYFVHYEDVRRAAPGGSGGTAGRAGTRPATSGAPARLLVAELSGRGGAEPGAGRPRAASFPRCARRSRRIRSRCAPDTGPRRNAGMD